MEGTQIIYIKNKYLPFLKKRQGFTFTMATFMLQCDYLQIAISDWDKVDGGRFIGAIMYNAAKLWNIQNGKKINFDESKVAGWLKRTESAQVNQIMETFFKSKIGGESLDNLILKSNDKEVQKKK